VVAKSEGIDPSTGTFSINIRIKDDGRNKLATGLFGKAIIQSSSRIAAWTVPFSAVLEGDKENGYVFVVDDDISLIKSLSRLNESNILTSSFLPG
jgi:multidrug efflux pump subunit AcrA (membrane-fusion protein)